MARTFAGQYIPESLVDMLLELDEFNELLTAKPELLDLTREEQRLLSNMIIAASRARRTAEINAERIRNEDARRAEAEAARLNPDALPYIVSEKAKQALAAAAERAVKAKGK